MPDKNIRIHQTKDIPNEQGIPLFRYKNVYKNGTWNKIKECLVEIEKILNRTNGNTYDEPIFKIQDEDRR